MRTGSFLYGFDDFVAVYKKAKFYVFIISISIPVLCTLRESKIKF